jgi:hypothetical protein
MIVLKMEGDIREEQDHQNRPKRNPKSERSQSNSPPRSYGTRPVNPEEGSNKNCEKVSKSFS